MVGYHILCPEGYGQLHPTLRSFAMWRLGALHPALPAPGQRMVRALGTDTDGQLVRKPKPLE
jgi:hypothetical protein